MPRKHADTYTFYLFFFHNRACRGDMHTYTHTHTPFIYFFHLNLAHITIAAIQGPGPGLGSGSRLGSGLSMWLVRARLVRYTT